MSNDVSSYFAEKIDACRGLSGQPLERALSRLLRDFQGHIWGWTKTACRSHGDRELMYSDDVFNIISFDMSVAVKKELSDPADEPIRNYYSYFQKIAQRSAFQFFHSSERTGFSNANGAQRRLSKINKTRREMSITLGREPSDQEVVDEVNRVATATRKDAKKQGALVTLDDLKTTVMSSLDGLVDEYGDSVWESESDEEIPLSKIEAPSLVEAIVDGCYNVSEDLGRVCELWIGEAMSEPPVIRTAREIALEMALRLGEVSALLTGCKEVAQAVCKDKLGIDSPFA